MARTTYVLRNGELVEKHLAAPLEGGRALHIISDTMDGAVHPCTGQMIDSKSTFRRVTREHGCIEVGDQKFPARHDAFAEKRASEARKRDIAQAIFNPGRGQARRFEDMGLRSHSGHGWG